MTPHEFTISAGELDAGGRRYRFPVRAAWMRGALEEHEAKPAEADGELDVRASKSGNDVVVHGTLKAELVVPCARCLTPVTFSVDDPLSVLFVPGSAARAAGPGEHEMGAEEADTLPYDGETVVLDDLVRDELILQTPSFPLCSETCPGMSPSLPKEGPGEGRREVDPRLAPLRRLIDPKE